MFQRWRIQIREGELAFQAGRLEEASQRLMQDDLVRFLPGKQLAEKIVAKLLEQTAADAEAGELVRGWKAWRLATDLLGPSQRLDEANLNLLARLRQLVDKQFQAARWQAALHLLADAESVTTLGPAEQVYRDAAVRLITAEQLIRRGRFTAAEAELLPVGQMPAIVSLIQPWLTQLQDRKARLRELTTTLHQAVSEARWNEALGLADELLEIAPEHRLAKETRRQAWQKVCAATQPAAHLMRAALPVSATSSAQAGPPVSATTSSAPAVRESLADLPTEAVAVGGRRPESSAPPAFSPGSAADDQMAAYRTQRTQAGETGLQMPPFAEAAAETPSDHPDPARCLLWVDGVGGYLLHWSAEIVIGQAHQRNEVDVPIVANIPRRQLRIVRQAESYLIEPLSSQQTVLINGSPLRCKSLLVNRDLLELGSGVQLRFEIPHPLSSTARLQLLSSHRTQPRTDGVLLVSESCVLGPQPHCHVVCRDGNADLVLYRQRKQIWIRAAERLLVDGQERAERVPLQVPTHVAGRSFSLSLEELDKCSPQPLL